MRYLILLSGGVDSALCLALLREKYRIAVFFDLRDKVRQQ